jgi:5-oxoprolinase (ATP-hydrolysing) subunit A
MTLRVDLNCDLGEGGPCDEALLEGVTSANIACGFHAGDPGVMRRTVEMALKKGVAIGAHPGLRDPEGFGRRAVKIEPQEAFDITLYQIGALQSFASLHGARLRHVKPHGALYNMAARDGALAEALAKAVRAADPALTFVGLAGSEMIRAARQLGLRAAEEAFADRGYRADGSLVPRGQPGALIDAPEEVARRAVRLVKEGRVAAADGTEIPIRADTICIHGDTPGAPDLVRALRAALAREGVDLRSLGAP